MSHILALSNSSLASSSYKSLSEEEQRKVKEDKKEREARSLVVEKAYVHDVYEQISGRSLLSFLADLSLPGNFTDSRYQPWPRVKQFLTDLEPGAFVCDVGNTIRSHYIYIHIYYIICITLHYITLDIFIP